ncbi:MAG: hypothetical protein Q9162_000536 [Coniocarpon cinnabarinum]
MSDKSQWEQLSLKEKQDLKDKRAQLTQDKGTQTGGTSSGGVSKGTQTETETVQIPDASLPTWPFGSHDGDPPDNPLIIDANAPTSRYLSFLSYRKWSQRLAAGLLGAGLQSGEAVVFASANSVAYPVVLLGVLMAGGVFSGCSPALDCKKLVKQVGEVKPRFMLVAAEGFDSVIQAVTSISFDSRDVFLFDDDSLFTQPSDKEMELPGGARHWLELFKVTHSSFHWAPFAKGEQLAAINYTSGSTVDPKGVMVTHRNFIANAAQCIKQQTHDPQGPENGGTIMWVMWPPVYQVTGQI